MKSIQRIIVAVDLSEEADSVRDGAGGFAKRLSAELHLVHAFDVRIPLVTPYEVAIPTAFIGEAREAAVSRPS